MHVMRGYRVLGLGLLVVAGAAQAAPMELGYQGRLLGSDGAPVEGTKTITFALYRDADISDPTQEPTATPVWTEDQQLALTNGFYATQLGAAAPLTSTLFDGGPLWLLLTVDGEKLLPLQKVTSVAYAIQSDTATNVRGGTVDATSITVSSGGSITVGGTEVIDAGGQINLTSALPTTCATGQVLKWDGSTWACAADADTQPAWSAISGMPAGFADGVDDDTVYSAGAGIRIDASNVISSTLGTSISTAEIDDGAVTSAKIADGSVTAADLAPGVAIPPGAVGFFAMATCPAGWIAADGSNVSRTTYAALFAALGVTWGVGNGIDTFGLPDLRGEFVRGLDNGRNVDPGRQLGQAQGQDFKSLRVRNDGGGSYGYSHGPMTVPKSGWMPTPLFGGYWSAPAGLFNFTWDGSEVRPRNLALQACIKT